MYADRVASAGSKRSLKERLNNGTTNSDDDFGDRGRLHSNNNAKRQRQIDDKWKHDLYVDEEELPQVSNPKLGAKDLRLKLQKKSSQQPFQSRKGSQAGVRDLREKLSGTMHSQPSNIDLPKVKTVADAAKPVKKSTPPIETPVLESKKISAATPATPATKRTQQKAESSVGGFLQSLGLDKYLITFQAEEVDMAALVHMNDDDLKALGIPMGPRKKILLALDSKARG